MDHPRSQQSRESVLRSVVDEILGVHQGRFMKVGIDGVDGAGKTVFAVDLIRHLESAGLAAVNVTVDGYHYPAEVRYRRGRSSPEGFFMDSYDYERFVSHVIAPFGASGDGRFVRAIHDSVTDQALETLVEQAPPGAVLVVDGIFLHRDELADYWDYSIFLDVDFAVSIPRMAHRDGTAPDPAAAYNRRYVDGQRIYLERCRPVEKATLVVDNTDVNYPRIVRRRVVS